MTRLVLGLRFTLRLGFRFRTFLGLTLGYMDDTSGVSNIATSTGIASNNSRKSGVGKASNAKTSRRTDQTIPSQTKTISITSIAHTMCWIPVPVSTVKKGSISIGVWHWLGNSSSNKQRNNLKRDKMLLEEF